MPPRIQPGRNSPAPIGRASGALGVAGPVAVVGRVQPCRDQGLDWMTG